MNWGFFFITCMLALNCGLNLAFDGTVRNSEYSFWWSVVAGGIQVVLTLWAMHWRF